jgi:hypothetical protein
MIDPSARAFASLSTRFTSALRRVGWGIADQALSSATNFAVGVFVARNVTTVEFGAFGLVFSTYLLVLGLTRALATEPLLVRYSHVAHEEWREGAAAALGAALLIGVSAGAVGVVAGVLIQGVLGAGLIALGITLPGLLVQDSWRMTFFASGRGFRAFANDGVWGVVLIVGFFLLETRGLTGVGWFTAAWGLGAGVAAVFGYLQGRVRPKPSGVAGWWRAQHDLASRYVGEFIVRSGGTQLITYAVGGIVSVAAVGALRAGQILLGPFNILFQGLWLIAVPEQVRQLREGGQAFKRSAVALSALLAALALVYGSAAQLLPTEIGRALLGESWSGGREVILPMALSMAGLGVVMGASSGLRALEAARRGLHARIVTTVLLLIGGLSGAVVGGAVGTALGMAGAYWVGGCVWWWHLIKALNARASSESQRPPDDQSGLVVQS